MNAVSFDCCGGCVPLEPGQSVQDVIDIHVMECDERRRLNFLATYRDDARRDFAACYDLDADGINKIRGLDNFPLEISGDALAIHQEEHS